LLVCKYTHREAHASEKLAWEAERRSFVEATAAVEVRQKNTEKIVRV
jgi:hypothetical protein